MREILLGILLITITFKIYFIVKMIQMYRRGEKEIVIEVTPCWILVFVVIVMITPDLFTTLQQNGWIP